MKLWNANSLVGKRKIAGHSLSAGKALALMAALAASLLIAGLTPPVFGQQQKSKIPIVGKLGSNPGRQAFSGKVLSLDLTEKVLNVNSLRGQDTEIFPIRKDIRVEGVNGRKLKLKSLTPGTSVLIYYEEKSGGREIKNIIVLESAKGHAKSGSAPPS
jgi:hypothetical protein